MAEPNQDAMPTLAQLAAAVVDRDINENILSKIEAEERKRRDSRIGMLHEDEARVIAIVKQNFFKKRGQVREEYHKRIDQRERSVPGLRRAKEEVAVAVSTSMGGKRVCGRDFRDRDCACRKRKNAFVENEHDERSRNRGYPRSIVKATHRRNNGSVEVHQKEHAREDQTNEGS